MIRIQGGIFRSRSLVTPKGTITRPTSSQLRQCVFNICQHIICDADVLDICAGSGAVGFEALSRGAKAASFIEHNRLAIFAIKENIKRLEVQNQATLCFGDALHVLQKLEAEKKAFDICYFDPPYSKKGQKLDPLIPGVISFLDQAVHVLKPGGLFFVEESIYADISQVFVKQLVLQSTRRFGDSQLFSFVKQSASI